MGVKVAKLFNSCFACANILIWDGLVYQSLLNKSESGDVLALSS